MQSAISAAREAVPGVGSNLPPGTNATQFVINLSASTSPAALTPPTLPELKRFKFFVSRRREEGRERFRLHMGYFNSQEDAEKLLELVREIYPAAWAGVAPGQKLHAPVPDVAPPPVIAGPVSVPTPPKSQVTAPKPPVTPPAPATAPLASKPVAEEPLVLKLVDEPVAPRAASALSESPKKIDSTLTPTLLELPVLGPAKSADAGNSTATHSLDSVRAAIASLGEAQRPQAPRVQAPTSAPSQPLKPAPIQAAPPASMPPAPVAGAPPAPRTPAPRPAQPAAPAAMPPTAQARADALSASQTLRVLEQGGIESTQTRRALSTEPTLYAVQLLWSVQPIDQAKIPPLAIFSAYTLYGAEGNRDGRRWYGLRLGFFTDTVSAQQVAHYVRSEFKAVSVVPVSSRERERASGATATAKEAAAPPAVAAPQRPASAPSVTTSGEFKLIDDRALAGNKPVSTPAPAPAKAGAGNATPRRGAKQAPGKRAKSRPVRATKANNKGKMSLEETLEILGANSLQIDQGRGELLNDSAVRRVPKDDGKTHRGSSLLSLIDRLTDKFGNS